jgi:hypothetical protein
MKHVGKMKNNSARVAIVYRTLPGDAHNALVVGTTGLTDAYHDSLMSVLESDSGQQANELADILAVRKFPDGNNMLEYLHVNGHLKKVPCHMVHVTPNTTTTLPLDELNKLIADQKGVTVDELAIVPEGEKVEIKPKQPPEEYKSKWDKARDEKAAKAKADAQPVVEALSPAIAETVPLTPAEMRSRADKLYKEAQALRKQADAIDPPKKKAKAVA